MLIRLLTSLAGPSGAYDSGSVIDWPDDEARRFIERGSAELPHIEPELATVVAPEMAAHRTRKGKRHARLSH